MVKQRFLKEVMKSEQHQREDKKTGTMTLCTRLLKVSLFFKRGHITFPFRFINWARSGWNRGRRIIAWQREPLFDDSLCAREGVDNAIDRSHEKGEENKETNGYVTHEEMGVIGRWHLSKNR